MSENVKKRMSKISSASKIISKTMKNCKQKNRDESLSLRETRRAVQMEVLLK